ncbi:MAG: hypothetical protein IAE80_28245 [Anaerolinea sp.]|nr:hypothetical protein [Anaerolinea sp.]
MRAWSTFKSYSRRLWVWLTEPAPSVVDFETRLRSRWLAAAFLVLIPLGVIVASIPALVDHNAPWEDRQVWAIAAALFLVLLANRSLIRRGRYKVAVFMAVVIASVTILAISVMEKDTTNPIDDVTYLLAVVLFTSTLMPQRVTAVVFVCLLTILMLMPLWQPDLSLETILKGPASLMIIAYALTVFGSTLRTRLEHHQMDLLRAENAERRRAEAQLRDSLAEKEVLIKEIHHRVKNNLQIISSLLALQIPGLADPNVRAQFEDSQNRIRTMALIHERLYRSENLRRIDFAPYLRDLTGYLIAGYQLERKGIRFDISADEVALDIDTAIPCGLLINELVSNALKHAFVGKTDGTISVNMRHAAEGYYTLTVRDDGVGFPDGLDYRNSHSLGLQLVTSLVRQLGGSMELSRQPGTTIVICFNDIVHAGLAIRKSAS